jgi:integrase
MERKIEKLTALRVTREKRPGVHADGGGLYLQVAPGGSKSWLYRYKAGGKEHWHGLGPWPAISLAQARERAAEARRLRLDGHDPIEVRRAARLGATTAMTFDECAAAYIAAHRAGWRNPKHESQWKSSLATYASPVFGMLPVAAIDTGLVMKVIEPLWTTKTETAARMRGRTESILDWAKARGYRAGENPARWRGHLDHLLAPKTKVRKVKHHAALPNDEVPALMAALRTRDGVAARALEFTILTAARVGEVIHATWDEIDFGAKTWLVPANRMKSGREHRVPLSERAVAILKGMDRRGDFIFRGARARRPLGVNAPMILLRDLGHRDCTVHGMRSAFRDWCAERTAFPSEVAEMALAHVVANKVEAAYRRGDLLEKRRLLMDVWAQFCSAPVAFAEVIAIRGAASSG